MSAAGELPFVELPAALVEEVLGQTSAIGDHLLQSFRQVREERARFRKQLVDAGLVMTETALGYPLFRLPVLLMARTRSSVSSVSTWWLPLRWLWRG